MRIYNSLTQKKELFKPISEDEITMYWCGITPHNVPHLGNARGPITADVLVRVLSTLHGNVKYARNITDIDDKIINKAKETGQSINEITAGTTKVYHDIMDALHVLPPTVEPKATESIDEMNEMINVLMAKGFAYSGLSVDGKFGTDIYFDTTKLPFGFEGMSNHQADNLVVQNENAHNQGKRHPSDFALWKADWSIDDVDEALEQGRLYFNHLGGHGRHGWHLECSTMIKKHLGETIDIHGGGGDLRFPHHEAEMMQSHSANGVPLANYWMHNGMITVNGKKMAKSTGNFITVDEALKRVPGEAIRFYMLKTHYRKPFDWSWDGLMEAKEELDGFYRKMQDRDYPANLPGVSVQVLYALADDLNTPLAIAELHRESDEEFSALLSSARLLGILNHSPEEWYHGVEDNEWIESEIVGRELARYDGDYGAADKIRKNLLEQGIILEDKPDGTTTWRKK